MKVASMPVSKTGLFQKEALMRNIASVAAGLECLEEILVKKGILEAGELMKKIEEFVCQRAARGEISGRNDD